jgi:site-specific DNA-methyltransferase (adenine-specific)
MQIEEVSIKAIKPYWRNPRNNEEGVAAVKKSIEEFGFNSPIIVDKEYVIIAGHTRYKALQQLGYETVPIVVADLPAQKIKQYRIADNKTSELSQWDYPKLVLELKELADLPTMQDYFPDLDLSSIVDTLPKSVALDVSDEDVAKSAELLGKNYTSRNEEERKGFIPMICPDCGYEYSLHIAALERMIDGIKKMIQYDGGNADTETLP